MLVTKIISSLDKCFIDMKPDDFKEITTLRMFKNERASIQIITYDEEESDNCFKLLTLEVEGYFSNYYTMNIVESIPSYAATDSTPKSTLETDSTFIRTSPGLYPDVLTKPMRGNCIPYIHQQIHSAFIDFEGKNLKAGKYNTYFIIKNEKGEQVSKNKLVIEVINASLPPQDTKVINWLHTDCLANYYNVKPWSDYHFSICRNFIKNAVLNGINTILMPVFTLPLDTHFGGERTTTQLIIIEKLDDKYLFNYSLVDKWIEICMECNVKYYEISHLFTQWGGAHAPKIMATVNGEYKKIFGWETDASSEEYTDFIKSFLSSFTEYLKNKGLKEITYFHLSDEPTEYNIDQYEKNYKIVEPYLKEWKIIDASSTIELYKRGLINIPIPSTGVVEKFLNEDLPERWCYYCCGPWVGYSNRFFGMHLARTRSLGFQMYKFGINGFLHWGYNFYNNIGSYDPINPFLNPACNCLSGDAYIVYPNYDGKPLDSIRLRAFKQGIDDIRVMKLAESFCSKEEVISVIENIIGTISFSKSVNNTETMLLIRESLENLIISRL